MAANSFNMITVITLITDTLATSGDLHSQLDDLMPTLIILALVLLITTVTMYNICRQRTIYLVDYACFVPNSIYRYPKATFLEHANLAPSHDASGVQFMARVLERSGLGDETNAPPSFHYINSSRSLNEAREEVKMVIFSAVDDLLFKKKSINIERINLLVVSCGAFSPTPALADMIMNRYKLRGDIRVINLSGMGCSGGLFSAGLAKDLLQAMPRRSYALVVSTEATTPSYYVGRKRSMLLANVLFRMGGFAALLSTSRANARFKLMQVVRRLTSAQDNSYRCAYQEEDNEGITGSNLSKDLTSVAGEALKVNLTVIGRHFLPTTEKIKYFLSIALRKLFTNAKIRSYIPDFRTAFEHFCIHAGGSAVINSVQQSLNLSEKLVEPSRMTLHRFGNQSTASVFYELAYIEAKGLMRQGDRVLMIGFGAGYECTTAVWMCIQPSTGTDGPWAQCIHRYPVDVTRVVLS